METLLNLFLSALVGAVVVYVFGIRRLSLESRNAFIQRQLAEFYSPMAGYRRRIRLKSELRVQVSNAASSAWKEVANRLAQGDRSDEAFLPYKRIISYDNRQFAEEFFPLYKKMLDLFADKYWLADDDTRQFYEGFLKYVEIWERDLADALPGDVLKRLDHSEENVKPFYDHIEEKLSILRLEIREPSFWKMRL